MVQFRSRSVNLNLLFYIWHYRKKNSIFTLVPIIICVTGTESKCHPKRKSFSEKTYICIVLQTKKVINLNYSNLFQKSFEINVTPSYSVFRDGTFFIKTSLPASYMQTFNLVGNALSHKLAEKFAFSETSSGILCDGGAPQLKATDLERYRHAKLLKKMKLLCIFITEVV